MIGRRTVAPPADSGSENPKGFDDFDLRLGDIMRGERATLGKSLLDVQRELKIKATYISAIENSDPSAFETPGFVAGYVRSYARYLNLDPEWAYKTFCEEGNFVVAHGMSAEASGTKSPKVAAGKTAGIRRDPFEQPNTPFVPRVESLFSKIEPGALGSMAVLVALIGCIGYGGWAVLQEVQRVQFTPVDQTPGVTAQVDPLAPGDTFIAGVTNDTLLQPSAPESLDRLYRPQALAVPVLTARDGPISTLDPSTVATVVQADTPRTARELTQTATLDLPVAPELPEVGAVRVVADGAPDVAMFAVRPAWVRVSAADGTVIFEKILDAGERYVLPKTEVPPVLRAGNPSSLYFSVAGDTYGPASTGPSAISNVALSADALKEKYTVADLTTNRALAKVVADLGPLRVSD